MKEFVGVTLKEGLYLIELSPRDIGGQAYKSLPKIILRSVISVKDVAQILINLEGF